MLVITLKPAKPSTTRNRSAIILAAASLETQSPSYMTTSTRPMSARSPSSRVPRNYEQLIVINILWIIYYIQSTLTIMSNPIMDFSNLGNIKDNSIYFLINTKDAHKKYIFYQLFYLCFPPN
jgi:hypothetical protein